MTPSHTYGTHLGVPLQIRTYGYGQRPLPFSAFGIGGMDDYKFSPDLRAVLNRPLWWGCRKGRFLERVQRAYDDRLVDRDFERNYVRAKSLRYASWQEVETLASLETKQGLYRLTGDLSNVIHALRKDNPRCPIARAYASILHHLVRVAIRRFGMLHLETWTRLNVWF